MTKRKVVAGSLVLVLALAFASLLTLAKPAEGRCWSYGAQYDAYHDLCSVWNDTNCLVVVCHAY